MTRGIVMSNSNKSTQTIENNNSSDKTESGELVDRVDSILKIISEDAPEGDDYLINELANSLEEMREALSEKELQLTRMTEQSETLACAQADAIVHSAEIIDELETTKQQLFVARSVAEQAAQDTQRLADTIFERSHDGVLVFQNRKCTACNDNALKLFGCQRDDIIGAWPNSFESACFENGSSASSNLKEMYDAVTTQNVSSIEVLFQGTTGNSFWGEITLNTFSMQNTEHVLVVVRDITARKQHEVELRQHSNFVDNIINAVPDQLSVKTTDHKVVLANKAFCLAHGVTREEIIGQDANLLLPSNLGERLGEIEDQLVSTGESKTTEHQLFQLDGTHKIVSINRSLFNETTSGDQFIVATSRDITEDRLREDRLRLLASVFNGASEGVAILSPDGQVCEANPAFLNMITGDQNFVGKPFNEILAFDLSEFESVLQTVAMGNSWSGKASVNGENNSRFSFWVSLSPSLETTEKSNRIIALVSDITELENTQAELRYQAQFDTLTGLPNRRYFREQLQCLIQDYNSTGNHVTICFLDLDDFKHVNDSSGHAAGDRLLQSVGRRIKCIIGDDAFVARFGGDEFAIILSEGNNEPGYLQQKLNELLIAFREPFSIGNADAVVGLSIGVTSYPEHGTDIGALMCNADIAMYAAKEDGKNRVRIFTSEMQDGVNTRHQVHTKLRKALREGEIRPYFQPKVCAITKMPVGCEALARWQTQDGEFISPADFIPIAEQTGLILELGEQVLRQSAIQAYEWFASGLLPTIAVNVSPHQLRHPDFIEQLIKILEETGAQAEWLELEITENAMMDDVEHAISVIDKLSSLGFRVAIDDFGTGYSSLSYLKTFPINTLKIDISFVRDITHDSQSNAIVRSIISLGKGLGLSIVAEGVETLEQAEILSESGCTTLQGYYFGKPMDARQYEEWFHLQKMSEVEMQ